MAGLSLSEIKNKKGQIIITSKPGEAPFIGVQPDSVMVENLDVELLGGMTKDELIDTLQAYTDQKEQSIYSNVGHVDTINGVRPDRSKDINFRSLGDIKIIPNPSENEIVICGHNGINGMVLVGFVETFDSSRLDFTLMVPSGFVDGPDLMLFEDGILLDQGRDYTFERTTSVLTFTESYGAPTLGDNIFAMTMRNGAVNMGIVRLQPTSGTIDGFNKKYTFNTDGLTLSNSLAWRNGTLAKAGTDFNIVNGNAIEFLTAPAADAYLEFFQMKAYGGLLTPVSVIGVADGTTKIFSVTDVDMNSANTLIFINGQLQNRYRPDYEIETDTKSLIFANAPADLAVIKAFKISMESDIVSINGVMPDTFRNIRIRGEAGIEVVPNFQNHEIIIRKSSDPGSGGTAVWKADRFFVADLAVRQYELSFEPIMDSELVIKAGVLVDKGDDYDYTISGKILTINPDPDLVVGDKIVVKYQI
jgi:hypothetical protein